MQRGITIPAILIATGIGIGIVVSLGVFVLIDNGNERSTTEQGRNGHRTMTSATNESRPLDGRSSKSNLAIPQRITDLTLSKSTYERRAEISDWILALTENQVITWLEQSCSLDWDISAQAREDFQTRLLQKLTPNSPSEALNFALARSDPFRFDLVQIVFYEWANVNLNASVIRATDLTQEFRVCALEGILEAHESLTLDERKAIASELGNESYATTFHLRKLLDVPTDNPKETWHNVVVLAEPNDEHVQILAQIAGSWIEASGIDVLNEIISSIEDEDMRASISLEILREIARSLPDQAFAFALDLETNNREFVARTVIQTWAEQDPHTALEAVKAVPSGQFRSDLEFSAVQQWVQRDPRDVLGRLHEVPISVREDAITESIYWIAQDAPTEAASFVQQLDKESQWKARDILMESWLSQDLEGAIDWAENSDSIESEVRPYLLHDVAAKVLWIDPKRAFQIARQVSLLADSSIGSEAMIIGRIAYSDLNLARELLPQVRSGDTKIQAYVAVASELVVQGDTQDALNLGSELSESDLDTFHIDLAQRWVFRDAAGLIAEMEGFPSAETRSKIALTLIQNNDSNTQLSDAQIEQLQTFLSTEAKATLENNPP